MVAKIVNLMLLGLFPVAWQAPLARAEVAWLFTTDEISIFSGIVELWDSDTFLCIIVTLFAVVAPYLKTVALVYAQFSDTETARSMLPLLEFLGRLSMTDVFLVAFYVIAYRGIGEIVVDWGLYLFTGLVLVSIWSSWATRRRRFRTVPRDDPATAPRAAAETRQGLS